MGEIAARHVRLKEGSVVLRTAVGDDWEQILAVSVGTGGESVHRDGAR